MSSVIWKKMRLDSLFIYDSSNQMPFTKKQLNISDIKDDVFNTAVVTQSERNNGITGYIEGTSIDQSKIMKNVLIYSLNFGTCFYQHDDFVLLDTHGSIFRLIPKQERLKNILDSNAVIGYFFSKMIMKICKNGVYNYSWKPNSQRSGLEYILLPCVETNGNDIILKENDRCFDLAVDYITFLISKVKANIEERTINKYTKKMNQNVVESNKYKDLYNKSINKIVWKKFFVGELFDYNGNHRIGDSLKNLKTSDKKTDEYFVANITASKENNGCVCFLRDHPKKKIGMLTMASDAAYAGICFYQEDYFVSTGHNYLIEVQNPKFKTMLDGNKIVYNFFGKYLSKIFCNGIHGFMRSVGPDFSREIILLPLIETSKEKSIWNFDNKYYSLAVDIISYLYYAGQAKMYEKKIQNYRFVY